MPALIFPLILCFLAVASTAAAQHKIFCYYGSWSHLSEGDAKFTTQDIDPFVCTHCIWSFARIEEYQIVINDYEEDPGNSIDDFVALRRLNPELKLLVSISLTKHSEYSSLIWSAKLRDGFINSTVDFLKRHNLDGLDMEWAHTTIHRDVSFNQEHSSLLLKELKRRFNEHGFLLSAAVDVSMRTARKYNIRDITQYLDFLSLMTYNLNVSDSVTGHYAGLYASPHTRGTFSSVESSVQYWLDGGCPKEKLLVGVPTFAKSWTLSDPRNHSIGASRASKGEAGPLLYLEGYLSYAEVCEQMNEGDWTDMFDQQACASYAFRGDQWVSYESPTSAKRKAEFIRKRELAGAVVTNIELDDFRGACGVNFPILRALNETLRK